MLTALLAEPQLSFVPLELFARLRVIVDPVCAVGGAEVGDVGFEFFFRFTHSRILSGLAAPVKSNLDTARKRLYAADMIKLTERQEEALKLLATGRTLAEIGVAMGVSERTAKAYSDTLRLKFSVKNKRDLILVAQSYDYSH